MMGGMYGPSHSVVQTPIINGEIPVSLIACDYHDECDVEDWFLPTMERIECVNIYWHGWRLIASSFSSFFFPFLYISRLQ